MAAHSHTRTTMNGRTERRSAHYYSNFRSKHSLHPFIHIYKFQLNRYSLYTLRFLSCPGEWLEFCSTLMKNEREGNISNHWPCVDVWMHVYNFKWIYNVLHLSSGIYIVYSLGIPCHFRGKEGVHERPENECNFHSLHSPIVRDGCESVRTSAIGIERDKATINGIFHMNNDNVGTSLWIQYNNMVSNSYIPCQHEDCYRRQSRRCCLPSLLLLLLVCNQVCVCVCVSVYIIFISHKNFANSALTFWVEREKEKEKESESTVCVVLNFIPIAIINHLFSWN